MYSDVVIEARGLAKAYAVGASRARLLLSQFGWPATSTVFQALHPLDLCIRRGDVVGVIGQNGSGKSTLLQLLCGTLQPSQGGAVVHGRLAALLELGAGFNPEFTGRENVFLNGALFGLGRSEIAAKFPAIEAFADIGEFIDKPVKTYSSGMFVRLAFAVLAHVDADVLVIDEALAVGDVFFTQKCMRFLEEFARRGTILFVSHDSASVVNLCNRALLLEHGRLLMEGSPREVTEFYLQRQYAQVARDMPLQSSVSVTGLEADHALPMLSPERVGEFGLEGMRIEAFHCKGSDGIPLHQMHGETELVLELQVRAAVAVTQPLVGFSLKDRHGKVLLGGNTEQAGMALPPLAAGEAIRVAFRLTLPALALGDYMLSTAAGDGVAAEHVMHHWIHDVWPLQSTCRVNSGLLEVPVAVTCGRAG